MKNFQKDLEEGIFNYLRMENNGALLVTGPWGCGKSYFFENELFDKFKNEGFKPIRVSLFGMRSLDDLINDIASEFAKNYYDKKSKKAIISYADYFFKSIKEIPFISSYIDLKGLLKNARIIYKFIPENAVICLDDLERAIEKFDINDLLGAINDLVENNNYKVIVIANKEYIDKKQNELVKSGNGKNEIFYEKVIEKTLNFVPNIIEVFNLLVARKDGESDTFEKFMINPDIMGCIDPSAEKSNRIRSQKMNIRTLKFAINHFKTILNNYITQNKDINDEVIRKQLTNQWMFVYALSLEHKRLSLDLNDYRGLDSYSPTASLNNNSIGWDKDDDNEGIFEKDGNENEYKQIDISERFVEGYYKNKESEYVFYPHLYRFIVGGVNFDFKEHLDYVDIATRKFNYKTNPVQKELNKWMGGYWEMSDEEAAASLKKLAEGVRNGELADLM